MPTCWGPSDWAHRFQCGVAMQAHRKSKCFTEETEAITTPFHWKEQATNPQHASLKKATMHGFCKEEFWRKKAKRIKNIFLPLIYVNPLARRASMSETWPKNLAYIQRAKANHDSIFHFCRFRVHKHCTTWPVQHSDWIRVSKGASCSVVSPLPEITSFET